MTAACVDDVAACYHCGQPAPAGSLWSAVVDGAARTMCCPGCAAAAEAIADAGLADYYGQRTAFVVPAADDADLARLRAYDDVVDAGDAVFTVEGIRCAACVWLIERRVAALAGVTEALLNVATERLRVRWDPAACRASDILAALRTIGYTAYPLDAQRQAAHLERERKTLFRRLFVAGLSMMQVMMYAFPVYLATDGTMDADMRALMNWAALLLTVPAVGYAAWPFLQGAWRDVRRCVAGMDVPVALGILAAFGASAAAVVRGRGDVYFDSITMFVFLLLGSRYLELDARRRAARALEGLQRAAPATALRMAGWPSARATDLVAAEDLVPGDVVLVAPGEAVPADGNILEGDTEIDLALLTGESRTRGMGPGDALPGGAVNVAQAIVVRVTSGARDSTLALLVRLVERAGQNKPALALWADRVGAWFVLALLALTALVFAFWQFVDPARAWPAAIAVLVVSCPCALSLATPTALAAATDRLLRRGALAVKPHVLETLGRATHVVFDKTGTLTHGHPILSQTTTFGGASPRMALQLAAALEQGSAHPLAQAIRDAAGPPLLATGMWHHAVGQGVEGEIGGRRYRLGNAAFVAGLAGGAAPSAPAGGATAVWLGSAMGWTARFDLVDALRPEAPAIVAGLRAAGKTVLLLSGDDDGPVREAAAQLGIDHALGNQRPEDKLGVVRGLQAEGAVVAMVGDGINDAAVLSGADVSFAMGQGAQLAQLHADCVLLGDGLAPLAAALDTAAATLRVIRQNLGWAMLYNATAIPAAASGLLNPWLSGAGMAASSALVVLNALRLRR
ncbi:heavy metal translocating P-type ATPase [Massilia pinisoli]|uniref:Heavy metal translocating P-type ATPase n=1 Tax=Massilia pinisoli TaxID=1772194 RepID=A0ABT1ZKS1_9BURK|nr:heavy metal translocating P-type ATPase [Massilia pinisoli]MCS0580517.1 heavy metal translocating P-type ATPase [Massilia pinisoli]